MPTTYAPRDVSTSSLQSTNATTSRYNIYRISVIFSTGAHILVRFRNNYLFLCEHLDHRGTSFYLSERVQQIVITVAKNVKYKILGCITFGSPYIMNHPFLVLGTFGSPCTVKLSYLPSLSYNLKASRSSSLTLSKSSSSSPINLTPNSHNSSKVKVPVPKKNYFSFKFFKNFRKIFIVFKKNIPSLSTDATKSFKA